MVYLIYLGAAILIAAAIAIRAIFKENGTAYTFFVGALIAAFCIIIVTASVNVVALKDSYETDLIVERAKAEAEANEIIDESITSQLCLYTWIKEWDGELPDSYSGEDGKIPFIYVDTGIGTMFAGPGTVG